MVEFVKDIYSPTDFEDFCRKMGGEPDISMNRLKCRFTRPHRGAFEINVTDNEVSLTNLDTHEYYELRFPDKKFHEVDIWYPEGFTRVHKPEYVVAHSEDGLSEIEVIYPEGKSDFVKVSLEFTKYDRR